MSHNARYLRPNSVRLDGRALSHRLRRIDEREGCMEYPLPATLVSTSVTSKGRASLQ